MVVTLDVKKDGCLIVMEAWKDLLNLNILVVGDRLLFVIHHGGDEVILFVKTMPRKSM